MVTISLIGEQPIPNLLPLRCQPPDVAVLVHTNLTGDAARRLGHLLPEICEVLFCLVSPYDISQIVRHLRALIEEHGWVSGDLLFNLTGGTKAMALAAYLLAAERRAPFLYLQSEGKKARLYRYEFVGGAMPQVVDDRLLPGLITIDDYIRAYAGEYHITGFSSGDAGAPFERAVFAALEPVVDEIVAGVRLTQALEIDLVLRCENQVGIAEVKTGREIKKGIDQLNTAGGQRYLGTYTSKVLISDHCWEAEGWSNLKELAEARRIAVVEAPSFRLSGVLSADEIAQIRRTICGQLGREVAG